MRELKDLNLCDDFLFKEVMKEEKLAIELLELILDLKGKIKKIKYIETEKTIDGGYDGKTVRLDVYIQDDYVTELSEKNLRYKKR